ncbi:efflux RND transporter periplasmic adaptor subunit [uncultured Microscilla sp.]|uniref:efflux RND transporter periplasmic adaptor subunit n=1 Tax=uncultured Microscilla sp. TaxID=432653 RepID=UPI00262D535B|nr:efflux RND transporter periplasmic adaptor subunit [uncultured Microscilla sp.]
MKKKVILPVIILGVLAAGYMFFTKKSSKSEDIFVKVKKSDFTVSVTSSGELYAKNSTKINGPTGLRQARLWQVKISRIIPEGTKVKEGEFIASLDRSELADKLKNEQTELDKASSQFTQAKLDTTLELREARDKLINLRYAQREKELVLEQSKYEPPATIKQAQIDLEKAKRALIQSTQNYLIKKDKAIAKMQEAGANLSKVESKVEFLQKLMKEFNITAPKSGMMIYARTWDGKKKREGSTISAWNSTVATLPDLSVMVSRTYINEVDIKKIKNGQKVNIGLDAFPKKQLTGKVIKIANVGEQKPNSDAKVFEVNIEIHEQDSLLLPSMTTSNNIIAKTVKNVLSVPLEAIHNQGDSLTYVFQKDGASLKRVEVMVGETNENEAVVLAGLTKEDMVTLSRPEEGEKMDLHLLDKTLKAKVIKEQAAKLKEEQRKAQEARLKAEKLRKKKMEEMKKKMQDGDKKKDTKKKNKKNKAAQVTTALTLLKA